MIDLHSDTIYRLWEDEKGTNSLSSSSFMIDKPRLEKAGVRGQSFALFTPMYDDRTIKKDLSAWEVVNELHDRFLSEIESSGIPQMREVSDLSDGKLHAILTTEEGAILEGDISRLETLSSWGVKIFGFTWNYENELAYPNSKDESVMNKPLKEKGLEALYECERLGIVVDVSHLNDGGFYDIAKHSTKPFVASHSNSRAMSDQTRNLSDEMLKVLADKGGVAGLNLCPAFLRRNDDTSRVSRISDMVRHIRHIYNVAGEDILAIGTDLDGIGGELEIGSPDKLYLLHDALSSEGFSSRILDKFEFGNAYRVLSECEVAKA